MINAVWKFPLWNLERMGAKPPYRLSIEVPNGTEIFSAGYQQEGIVVWGFVNPNTQVKVQKNFFICWTGEQFKIERSNLKHLTTLQITGLVYHIFEEQIHDGPIEGVI